MKRADLEAGLSLVELLVGIAAGLLVVAAAINLLLAQLREARSLSLGTQLAQDLHRANELIVHELRRSGHWDQAVDGVRHAGAGAVSSNPLAAEAEVAGASLTYRYDSAGRGGNGACGFRLRHATIEMQLDAGPWQALTDPTVLAVTDFRMDPARRDVSLAAFCLAPCPSESGDCPPRARVMSYDIDIQAHLVTDPRVRRSAHSRVRVRNDAVVGRCGE